jgi:hypothetical protein
VTGEVVTASQMNTHVRDNLLAGAPHLIVLKPSDESLTSNTTFQPDNDLILPVGANEVWEMLWLIRMVCGATGDLKVQWTFPTNGRIHMQFLGQQVGGTIAVQQLSSTTSPAGPITMDNIDADGQIGVAQGLYIGGSNAGNVALEWAQNASDATATTVQANSLLRAAKRP